MFAQLKKFRQYCLVIVTVFDSCAEHFHGDENLELNSFRSVATASLNVIGRRLHGASIIIFI